MRWLTLLPLTLSLVTAGSATSPLFSDSLAVHEATHSTWSSHDGMSAFSKRASKAISSYSGPKSGHATFYGDDPNGGNCKLDRKDWVSFTVAAGNREAPARELGDGAARRGANSSSPPPRSDSSLSLVPSGITQLSVVLASESRVRREALTCRSRTR